MEIVMQKSQGKPYFAYFTCDPIDGELTNYSEALEAAKQAVTGDFEGDAAFVYECIPRAFVTKGEPIVELITSATAPKKRGRQRKKK